MQESQLPAFQTDNLIRISGGVDFGISDNMTFSLQGVASSTLTTPNENVQLLTALTYAATKNTLFQISLSSAIAEERSFPHNRIMLGWHYSPSSTNKLRFSLTDKELQELEYRKTVLAKLSQLEGNRSGRLISQTDSTAKGMSKSSEQKNTGLRIELVDSLSDVKLMDKLARILNNKGYNVVLTNHIRGLNLDVSSIHYKIGLAKEAVELGHKIGGDQIVIHRNLPGFMDMQLIIGKDIQRRYR